MSAAQSSTSNVITDTCKISTDAPQRRWPTEEGNDAGATALKRQRLVFSSAKAASQRKIKKLAASNTTEEMLPVSTRYMQKKACRLYESVPKRCYADVMPVEQIAYTGICSASGYFSMVIMS